MSEDVSEFLKQVKDLEHQRAGEDDARSKELEEKILQDRKERQARRAGTPHFLFTILHHPIVPAENIRSTPRRCENRTHVLARMTTLAYPSSLALCLSICARRHNTSEITLSSPIGCLGLTWNTRTRKINLPSKVFSGEHATSFGLAQRRA